MALRHHLGPQGSVIHFHTVFSTSASCAVVDIALSHGAHDYAGVYAGKLDTPLMHGRLGTSGSAILLCHVLVSTRHRHCDHLTRLGTQPLVVKDRSEMSDR